MTGKTNQKCGNNNSSSNYGYFFSLIVVFLFSIRSECSKVAEHLQNFTLCKPVLSVLSQVAFRMSISSRLGFRRLKSSLWMTVSAMASSRNFPGIKRRFRYWKPPLFKGLDPLVWIKWNRVTRPPSVNPPTLRLSHIAKDRTDKNYDFLKTCMIHIHQWYNLLQSSVVGIKTVDYAKD